MKLTPTQAQRAFVPLIALAMSALMSCVMTAFNFGIAGGFVGHWLQNWVWASPSRCPRPCSWFP